VSYLLNSRSGSEQDFINMVNRCNKVGVRIIVDGVMNHMVGNGQTGTGSSGTYYNTQNGNEQFAMYSKSDFNDPYCHSKDGTVQNYNDANEVRECKLSGLVDLNQSSDYVRQQLIAYLNHLIDIGVAGFRLDASKNMWPDDIKYILDHSNNLNSTVFGQGKRPFVVQEVIDMCGTCEAVQGDDYVGNGRITNFRYGSDLCTAARRKPGGNFEYLDDFGTGWGYWPDNEVLVFVDNHDNQRSGGDSVLTYKDGSLYIMGVTYMLAWSYGYPRVMSSFYFTASDQGPPSSGSPNFATGSPTFNTDQTCNSNSGWVCEHRWPAIRRMAGFRSAVMFEAPMDVVTTSNRIAFRRGNRGFFALNNDPSATWTQSFQTGLPAGTYCDVISGEPSSSGCTGPSVNVDSTGKASISIPAGLTFAIHIYSKSKSSPTVPPVVPKPTLPPVNSNYKRTAVFIQKQTTVGQNLFVRGGLDTSKNTGCSVDNSHCESDKCSMQIVHETNVNKYFATYIDWAQGDHCLDWYGPEPDQGTYDGQPSIGSPMAYTTNDKADPAYNPLNTFGAGYWLIDMKMDCSKTLNGWFELKGYLQGGDGWETNRQQSACTGSAGGSPPYQGQNHFARCGYINIFDFDSNSCIINNF
jgi:alpha-amylase